MAAVQSSSESDRFGAENSPHGIHGEAYRPVLMGSRGAVVANHPLAAEAGMRTLQRGGNAVDAAVAIGFALGAAEPQGSGLGGDGFLMIHMRDKKTVEVVNGTGAAPLSAVPTKFSEGIPTIGALGASTPGIVDALLSAHEKHGNIPLASCIEPAIELCEDGVPVSHFQAALAQRYPALFEPSGAGHVFAPHGRPLEAGDMRRNPDLGRTYRLLASDGRDAFYRGPIAEEISRFCSDNGGLLTREDFARYEARWQEPISTSYRSRTVYEAPPNSSGHVLLQELNLYENFDASTLGYMTPESIHLMVEAKKLAFADREAYLADPEHIDVPIEGLLSKAYAAERARFIDPERAASRVSEGDPWKFQARRPDENKRFHKPAAMPVAGEDTTHFCVIDRWGNAVGELQSIQTMFGSCVIAGSTGILLNNRMTYWHLDRSHINYLRPGHRVRHTMNPVMVFSASVEAGGWLELMCGTPGGDTQVQTNFQVVTSVFDHGLTVAEAIDGPRWTHYQDRTDSTYPHNERNKLSIESRVPREVVTALHARGHDIEVVPPFAGNGSVGAIQVHPESGALMAASDPRRDGHAVVW